MIMRRSSAVSADAQNATRGITQGIGAALGRAWSTYLKYRMQRQAYAHLHAMSDRELKDIGLSRAQIGIAVEFGAAGIASPARSFVARHRE
jgi:uncharacterized protein YjiS (DUF1127 family)